MKILVSLIAIVVMLCMLQVRSTAQLSSDSPSSATIPTKRDTSTRGLPSAEPVSNQPPPSSTASGSTLPSGGPTQQRPQDPAPDRSVVTPSSDPGKTASERNPGVRENTGSNPNNIKVVETPVATTGGEDTAKANPIAEYPRLLLEQYTDYGGLQRYTMLGKMPYKETHLSTMGMSIYGGALLGLAGIITWYQQAWYPDSTKGPFNFQVDWGYAKLYDKLGHAFGGWMSSYCSYESFIACGMNPDDAALWGAIGGLFYQTTIEVQDGFHSNYGFDWTDQLGNIAGAAYFYLQRKVPYMQNFELKWSVGANPRDAAREAAQTRSRLIVDDYDRQNMWGAFHMHNILPESLKPFWPKWLNLAVGVGVRDVELTGYTPYRTLHIALDYNLRELLPDLGWFNWLVQGLDAFHLPSPAIQLHPTVKFQWLFPITL